MCNNDQIYSAELINSLIYYLMVPHLMQNFSMTHLNLLISYFIPLKTTIRCKYLYSESKYIFLWFGENQNTRDKPFTKTRLNTLNSMILIGYMCILATTDVLKGLRKVLFRLARHR